MDAPRKVGRPRKVVAQGDLVEVTLVRGVLVNDQGTFRQGDTVTVTSAEAQRLQDMRMVQGDDYVAHDEVQDGTLRVVASDGPQIGHAQSVA